MAMDFVVVGTFVAGVVGDAGVGVVGRDVPRQRRHPDIDAEA